MGFLKPWHDGKHVFAIGQVAHMACRMRIETRDMDYKQPRYHSMWLMNCSSVNFAVCVWHVVIKIDSIQIACVCRSDSGVCGKM